MKTKISHCLSVLQNAFDNPSARVFDGVPKVPEIEYPSIPPNQLRVSPTFGPLPYFYDWLLEYRHEQDRKKMRLILEGVKLEMKPFLFL